MSDAVLAVDVHVLLGDDIGEAVGENDGEKRCDTEGLSDDDGEALTDLGEKDTDSVPSADWVRLVESVGDVVTLGDSVAVRLCDGRKVLLCVKDRVGVREQLSDADGRDGVPVRFGEADKDAVRLVLGGFVPLDVPVRVGLLLKEAGEGDSVWECVRLEDNVRTPVRDSDPVPDEGVRLRLAVLLKLGE